ncbi:MAG: flagellar basal body rod C-terminal domain-containing protein [Candidatus Devosia phytovorans]|uniref:Flagellar basal body rod C-terminal domain-containing protein n=1 Tax=Candidatus Devosia phytovorans TaxID=3121372 RepID=A0AAJ5VWS6_9HYPH|nr:flagellar basal body rod C-terminal domain-containing protein [Devosia sp.]WEK04834.1 MAG: flagellar basal body rod C-terminal domain-containing protein [Devosia sp.]
MNISSIGAAGMLRASDRFEASATRIARTGTGQETSDLATDVVDMMSAEIDFKASAKIMKMADEMARSTIDILA